MHDFKNVIEEGASKDQNINDDESDEEDDTILSSTVVHQQLLPGKVKLESATKLSVKKASCRAVRFSNINGNRLYTGGTAGDLCCLDAEVVSTFSTSNSANKSILWRIDNASSSAGNTKGTSHNPLHTIHQLPTCSASGSLIVTGDDLGGVRLWDERLCDPAHPKSKQQKQKSNNSQTNLLQLPQGCVLSWKQSKDYISSFANSEDGNTLLATSADGTLSVFDLRKASTSNVLQNQQAVRTSDPQDDELLALTTMKNGKKVVCGTQEGVLAIWSWGTWGDVSDRFPTAHQGSSIDAILKVDEDTLLTGSSDGLLRVVTVHPDKLIGALGDHDGFPIESLEYNATRSYVGSLSHDRYIRLWDTKILFDDDDDDDAEDDDQEMDTKMAAATAPTVKRGGQASDDEWEDMDEDEDEEMASLEEGKESDDSDSDDSDDSGNMPSKHDKRANKFKSKNEEFFADL